MEKRNVTVSAIVAAIVLIGDQLSKHWAETWLRTNGEYKIWDGVLHLRYVENRGAAFGMMQGGKWFFLAITGIACAAMLYFLIKERKRLHFMMTFSLALLLSGAHLQNAKGALPALAAYALAAPLVMALYTLWLHRSSTTSPTT